MYKLKLSIGVQLGDAENNDLIKGLKTAEVDTLEVAACEVCSSTREEQDIYFSKMEKRLKKFKEMGFYINSFHMTFGPLFCYFNFDEKARLETVERSIDICKRVAPFGVNYIVTHTNGWDFPVGGDREKEDGGASAVYPCSVLCAGDQRRVFYPGAGRFGGRDVF